MADTQDDPFANVSFTSPVDIIPNGPDTGPISQVVAEAVPTASADALNFALKGMVNSQPTAFNTILRSSPNMTPASNARADTAGGIARVNGDTGVTGVVAYKDANGRMVLTNVARDAATGRETPLLASNDLRSGVAQKIDGPLPLANILNQLSATNDSNTARGLFASFQEAATIQQVKIQQDALALAQTKLGLPSLEQQLTQAQAADRADPKWYAGIGDSPITQKLRTEVEVARGYAATEAQRNLANNLSYNLLGNQVKQAQLEMTRVQKLIDRKDLITDNISLRSAERTAQKQDDLEQRAEGMPQESIARIQMLQGQDFQDAADPRVKAYQIYANTKDKDFHAAVDAQGDKLPILAIQGNKYAQQLVVQSESSNTGQTQDQVKQNIATIQKTIGSPDLLQKLIDAKYGSNKEAAKAEFGNLNANLKSLDPNKKQEATDYRIQLALDFIKQKKTQTFTNDVSSWGSNDPNLLAASDKAFQTTGKKDVDNTLAAYVGDSTGPDLLQKLGEFRQIAHIASLKQQKSVFGQPDVAGTDAIISRYAAGSNTFQKWLQSTKAAVRGIPVGTDSNAMLGLIGNVNMAGKAVVGVGNGVLDLFKPNPSPIDPITSRPFNAE